MEGTSKPRMKVTIPRQQSLIVPEIQNPFVHKLHLGYLDVLKVVIMSVTVVPIRILGISLCILIAWVLASIALAFRTEEDKQQPLTGWRKSIGSTLAFLGRVMVFFWGFQNVKVIGKPTTSKEAPVIATAPHSSFFDPMVFFYCAELPSSLSRAENNKIPIVSALLNFTQPVLVKREDPNSRQNTIKEIERRAKTNGDWPQIIIFPEGTCTNRSCLITFKLGAFHPGVPVQPVCLKYPNRIDTLTWTWEGPGAFTLMWLTLCQFNTNLEIEFLPVYTPNQEEKDNPKLFASNVRDVMAKALKVPITDHTFDDCRLMQKARKLQLPVETGIVEFTKLHKKLGVSLDQMQGLLEKFRSIDIKGKGHVTIEEFANYLKVPVSDSLKEVFAVYDRDGSGSIDFREYVIGLSLVSAPVNTEDTLSLAFQLFDTTSQGSISQDDLYQILHNAFNMTGIDVAELFNEVDADQDGKISYDDFRNCATKKPEYAPLFMAYQRLKEEGGNTNGNAQTESLLRQRSDVSAEDTAKSKSAKESGDTDKEHIKAE